MELPHFPFNPAWQDDFAVCKMANRVFCLLCNKEFSTAAKDLIQSHYTIFHHDFHVQFPPNTCDRRLEIIGHKLDAVGDVIKISNISKNMRKTFNTEQSLSSMSSNNY